ncbi:MAG TPA: GLUG motif-containing protein, partial [Candidatus Acidoferrum sp.]|nr:GLUG motif-containing protein [Candidatus Acidoferrum sp.]
MTKSTKGKKFLSLLLAATMALSLLPMSALPALAAGGPFAGGAGVEGDPYIIVDAAGLNAIRDDLDAHYELGASVFLYGNWTPIGSDGSPFTGVLDGNWYSVNGVGVYTSDTDCVGFFSVIDGAEIREFRLSNVDIQVLDDGRGDVGALAGQVRGGSSLEYCYAQGAVMGSYSVGGLVGGITEGSRLENCFAAVNVTANTNTAGGLAGFIQDDSSAENCAAGVYDFLSTGDVQSNAMSVDNSYAGGLFGRVTDSAVTNCYAAVDVDGWYAGGLIGVVDDTPGSNSAITDCYAAGEVTGHSGCQGGLIGVKIGSSAPEVAGSYYDTTSTGQATSAGGTGLPTEDMWDPATYTDAEWDDEVWHLASSEYPELRWLTPQTVIYMSGGDEVDTYSEPVFYAIPAPGVNYFDPPLTPPEAGQALIEWNTEEDGTGQSYLPDEDEFSIPLGGLTLYAIWAEGVTVSYDLNGAEGDAPETETLPTGGSFSPAYPGGATGPDDPDLGAGYPMTFGGWVDGDGNWYSHDALYGAPEEDITLFAVWEPYQDGSADYPYLVNDYIDLLLINNRLEYNFLQTADIAFPEPEEVAAAEPDTTSVPEGCNFVPIGDYGNGFTGVFDGAGYTISNLIYEDDGSGTGYIGLFGYVDGAEIKNTTLEDVNISTANNNAKAGGLVGQSGAEAVIENCHVSGSVTASGSGVSVGGLIGVSSYVDVSRCSFEGDVTASGGGAEAGGLIGYHGSSASVSESYAVGDVSGGAGAPAGGLIGYKEGGVTNCYAIGSVETGEGGSAGGLLGQSSGGTTAYCYAAGTVAGEGAGYLDGLVGYYYSGTQNGNFFDSTVSGITGSSYGYATPTAGMFTQTTYSGSGWNWYHPDSNPEGLWRMGAGNTYPWLTWQGTSETPDFSDGYRTYVSALLFNWNLIKGDNASPNGVTQALNLWTTGYYGTSVSWESDDPAVNASTGAVTPPTEGSVPVTLTATITSGEMGREKTFALVVGEPSVPAGYAPMTLPFDRTLVFNGENTVVEDTYYRTFKYYFTLEEETTLLFTGEGVGADWSPAFILSTVGDADMEDPIVDWWYPDFSRTLPAGTYLLWLNDDGYDLDYGRGTLTAQVSVTIVPPPPPP